MRIREANKVKFHIHNVNGDKRLVWLFQNDPVLKADRYSKQEFVNQVFGPDWYYVSYWPIDLKEDAPGTTVPSGTIDETGRFRALVIRDHRDPITTWLPVNHPFWRMRCDRAAACVDEIYNQHRHSHYGLHDWSGHVTPEEEMGIMVRKNYRYVGNSDLHYLDTGDDIPGMPGMKALVVKSDFSNGWMKQVIPVKADDPVLEDWTDFDNKIQQKFGGFWRVEKPFNEDDYCWWY